MTAPQPPRTAAIAPPTVFKSLVHHVSLTQYKTTSPHHNPSKIIPSITTTSSPPRCTTGDAPVVLTDTRGRAWPSENGQRLKNPSMCARKARALFRLFLLAVTFVVITAAAPALQWVFDSMGKEDLERWYQASACTRENWPGFVRPRPLYRKGSLHSTGCLLSTGYSRLGGTGL
jgi:hypothetical protein